MAVKTQGFSSGQKFDELIKRLLDDLEWTKEDLAKKAGSTRKASFADWSSGWSPVDESKIFSLALCLFDEARKRKSSKSTEKLSREKRIARYATLTSLVNDLLRAAGYATLDTGLTNATWRELHSDVPNRKFRIGWTPLSHYCRRQHDGLAFDLGVAVAKLLNLKPEWVKYDYSDAVFTKLMDEVRDGAIDAIAPFMFQIPSRNARIRFTESIGFYERFAVVAGTDHISQVVAEAAKGVINHVLCFVEEDASEVMGRLLFYSRYEEKYPNEETILDKIIAEPFNENKHLRCFVTGAVDVDRLRENPAYGTLKHANLGAKYDGHQYDFHLPTAFAVGAEEPRLAEAINVCLRILKSNGFIYQHLRHKYRDDLAHSVEWEDVIARRATQNHSNGTDHI